jgi:hypothetical protein
MTRAFVLLCPNSSSLSVAEAYKKALNTDDANENHCQYQEISRQDALLQLMRGSLSLENAFSVISYSIRVVHLQKCHYISASDCFSFM